MTMSSECVVPTRQRVLHQQYREAPHEAWIRDYAQTVAGDTSDPFHGEVEPANNAGHRWAYGIHRAVGGDHDAPNPGDLLASALAACLHSTIGMISQWLEIEVADLTVDVSAEVDVRGALRVDSSVPVGFQRMHVSVTGRVVSGGNDTASLKTLAGSAEACCVVMQTLKQGVDVRSEWRLS
ncbi:OsmC family protein [Halomonas sp. I1]|uniref:OsmC family protein n=1 Tax=Halomonas sp. I1 TaxID=393536 RepID=UPI0028DE4797|nr:OsmC family protein [Halomonas sp. I1]MDT8895894.1 OsmC family protein [Halomonas sp. I1]